jgi:hypothetical protein
MLLAMECIMEFLVDIEVPQELVYNHLVNPGRMTAELETEPNGISRIVISEKDVAFGRDVELCPFTSLTFSCGWEKNGVKDFSPKMRVATND